MGLPLIDVRFTPKSGHWRATVGCPLWANNGHPRYLCELGKSPVMKRAETITKEAIVQMIARLKTCGTPAQAFHLRTKPGCFRSFSRPTMLPALTCNLRTGRL
jgi:hypothetical protein